MADLEWKPCEHADRVDVRRVCDPPWPRRELCLDCGRPVLVHEDGTISEEVRGL